MRATDKTHRKTKHLHLWMLVSSLALVAVTVWMVAADHWRPWKDYQQTYRDRIEPWMTEARIQQERSPESLAKEEQLLAALAEARTGVPRRELIDSFRDELAADANSRGVDPADFADVEAALAALEAEPGDTARDALIGELLERIAVAALRQENAERRLRFRRAEFDEARTAYEAAVGQRVPQAKLTKLQGDVDSARMDVDELTAERDRAAGHHRRLSEILGRISEEEDAAQKALADHRRALDRLSQALDTQQPNTGRRILSAPIVDPLGRPLAIDQIWLPELTIDYNFREVARFDRCVTCHQGIAKSAPGSPGKPALRPQQELTVELATPSEQPKQQGPDQLAREPLKIEPAYGFALAGQGMLDPAAATVVRVLRKTPAAIAGLMPGDVIVKIDDHEIKSRADVYTYLLHDVEWGKPLKLEIRRGVPQPFCSHPRLDLYVGSLSPHPMAEFGCTICHDGQGSATEFKFASHTPNDPAQRKRWRKQHDWFYNEHWNLPMLPERFAESRCLKCHHEVADLDSSARFPEPPAPKLLAGYNLVRQYGCFGCHEISGVAETGRSIGPDMRLEPNYTEAAQGLVATGKLNDKQQVLARQVMNHPEDAALRNELVQSILRVGRIANPSSGDFKAFQDDRRGIAPAPGRIDNPSYSDVSQGSIDQPELVALLAFDPPHPGTMRKVGPSLRHVAKRLDIQVLINWIGEPAGLRPATRMPRLYGMHGHLDGRALDQAERFEAVEQRAIAEYLLAASQPIEPPPAPEGITETPSPERGKILFQIHGCLACHKHADFPEGKGTQGPDLTIWLKYGGDAGGQWLTGWLRDPHHYSPRTLMPNPLLELTVTGEDGELTYPALDLAASLIPLSRRRPLGWSPVIAVERDLDELALLHLAKSFPKELAKEYLKDGIPESMAGRVQGDAAMLLGAMTQEKKLRYVGRRTIAKRGCYGCHDIPGFENAQQIGPALSDWGRKQESLLAFERINRYVAETRSATTGRGFASSDAPKDADRGFFREALLAHRREGFLWQKLHEPRSFDYKKAQNKPYNESLTMGNFGFTDEQVEAISTFVLGLVADPPAEKYVYQPDRATEAIIRGGKVMTKYACAECHTTEMERWSFAFDPDEFEGPVVMPDFPFMKPHAAPQQIAASLMTDDRGLGHAQVTGMPQIDADGALQIADDDEDDDGNEILLYSFAPWQPGAINGDVYGVGGPDVLIWSNRITAKRPPQGGMFARLLYPVALAEARKLGANPAGPEAWGWGPPPLMDEGAKVQPAWLHDYLLRPTVIRPAAVLRMPQYNLSPGEAAALVDYFAAVAGVDFPYSSPPIGKASRRQQDLLCQVPFGRRLQPRRGDPDDAGSESGRSPPAASPRVRPPLAGKPSGSASLHRHAGQLPPGRRAAGPGPVPRQQP